jgi:hypothetical protein
MRTQPLLTLSRSDVAVSHSRLFMGLEAAFEIEEMSYFAKEKGKKDDPACRL